MESAASCSGAKFALFFSLSFSFFFETAIVAGAPSDPATGTLGSSAAASFDDSADSGSNTDEFTRALVSATTMEVSASEGTEAAAETDDDAAAAAAAMRARLAAIRSALDNAAISVLAFAEVELEVEEEEEEDDGRAGGKDDDEVDRVDKEVSEAESGIDEAVVEGPEFPDDMSSALRFLAPEADDDEPSAPSNTITCVEADDSFSFSANHQCLSPPPARVTIGAVEPTS